jgi:hypothetical protein
MAAEKLKVNNFGLLNILNVDVFLDGTELEFGLRKRG